MTDLKCSLTTPPAPKGAGVAPVAPDAGEAPVCAPDFAITLTDLMAVPAVATAKLPAALPDPVAPVGSDVLSSGRQKFAGSGAGLPAATAAPEPGEILAALVPAVAKGANGKDKGAPKNPVEDDLPEPRLEPALAWLLPPPIAPPPAAKMSLIAVTTLRSANAQSTDGSVAPPIAAKPDGPAALLLRGVNADLAQTTAMPPPSAREPGIILPPTMPAFLPASIAGARVADLALAGIAPVPLTPPESAAPTAVTDAVARSAHSIARPTLDDLTPRPPAAAIQLPPHPDAVGAVAPATPLAATRHNEDPQISMPLAAAAVTPSQTVAPTANAQQAGIDLTRDPGLHRMIDRIETLRDAADARDTRIRLIPDALGPVDVSVRRDGDAVHVHFTAVEAGTRQLIIDAQPRLADLAEARGVRIDRATIDGGASQGNTAGDGQQPGRQPHAPTTSRTPPRATAGDDKSTTDQRIA